MSNNPWSQGQYNSTTPVLTNGEVFPVQLDSSGNMLVNIAGSSIVDPAECLTGTTVAPSKVLIIGGKTVDSTPIYSPIPLSAGGTSVAVSSVGSSFSVQVASVGVIGGGGVPSYADYSGIHCGANLVGRTGMTLGGQNAASVAIVDASGNQITTFGAAATAYTKQFGTAAFIGTTSLIAGSGSQVITVYKINVVAAGAANFYFLDSTPTTKSAVYILTGNGSSYGDFANGSPLWTCAAGKAFEVNSTTTATLNWEIWYTQI